ncbi:MAG TPA: hypothetical protein VJ895_01485 [Candidatus Nanoarchaeia archaeon]|nr:hypothetical protein [Candidatus Nanoarchaeia archaeon]
MNSIKNTRNYNMKKCLSKTNNFGFILYQTNLKHNLEALSEYEFKKEISKLKEKTKPNLGDILILTTESEDIIKYTGIISTKQNQSLEIWHEEFGKYEISSLETIIEKYSQFRPGEWEPMKIKYYESPLSKV